MAKFQQLNPHTRAGLLIGLFVALLSCFSIACDVEDPSDAIPANWDKVDARETAQAQAAIRATVQADKKDTCPNLASICGARGVKDWGACLCNEEFKCPVAKLAQQCKKLGKGVDAVACRCND